VKNATKYLECNNLTHSWYLSAAHMPSKEFKSRHYPKNNKTQKATNAAGKTFPRYIWYKLHWGADCSLRAGSTSQRAKPGKPSQGHIQSYAHCC